MVCCCCCPHSPPQQKKQKQARKAKEPKEKRTNEYGVTVRYSATPSQATYDRMQRALPGVLKGLFARVCYQVDVSVARLFPARNTLAGRTTAPSQPSIWQL